MLSKLDTPQHIDIDLELDELDVTSAESKATYQEIKDYVLEHSGLKVSSLYFAQVKQKHGIIERECYNAPKSEGGRVPQCPEEKVVAIEDALRHFGMIS
ncbi:MAG: RNA methyltransferase [Clostridia bacterium]|nr:RNA methyltransferase [Clostridia bacterium]